MIVVIDAVLEPNPTQTLASKRPYYRRKRSLLSSNRQLERELLKRIIPDKYYRCNRKSLEFRPQVSLDLASETDFLCINILSGASTNKMGHWS